jgi:hypothetical protein
MARMTHNQSEPAKYAETKEATDIVVTDEEAKQWEGWKTALKPAHEPIVMARKPFKGSTIDNVLEHGTGALNIDATRIPTDETLCGSGKKNADGTYTRHKGKDFGQGMMPVVEYNGSQGRYPSNVIMDAEAGAILDESTPHTKSSKRTAKHNNTTKHTNTYTPAKAIYGEHNTYGDEGGVSRFFYCPKVSRAERHAGFEAKNIPTNPEGMWDVDGSGVQYNAAKNKASVKGNLDHIPAPFGNVQGAYVDGERMAKVADDTQYAAAGNNHPTVKPVELMKYLIKLVTPKGGIVLDPFNGSGSTGMAAVELGYDYVGCELDPDYVSIANKRIAAWEKKFDTPSNKLLDFDE